MQHIASLHHHVIATTARTSKRVGMSTGGTQSKGTGKPKPNPSDGDQSDGGSGEAAKAKQDADATAASGDEESTNHDDASGLKDQDEDGKEKDLPSSSSKAEDKTLRKWYLSFRNHSELKKLPTETFKDMVGHIKEMEELFIRPLAGSGVPGRLEKIDGYYAEAVQNEAAGNSSDLTYEDVLKTLCVPFDEDQFAEYTTVGANQNSRPANYANLIEEWSLKEQPKIKKGPQGKKAVKSKSVPKKVLDKSLDHEVEDEDDDDDDIPPDSHHDPNSKNKNRKTGFHTESLEDMVGTNPGESALSSDSDELDDDGDIGMKRIPKTVKPKEDQKVEPPAKFEPSESAKKWIMSITGGSAVNEKDVNQWCAMRMHDDMMDGVWDTVKMWKKRHKMTTTESTREAWAQSIVIEVDRWTKAVVYLGIDPNFAIGVVAHIANVHGEKAKSTFFSSAKRAYKALLKKQRIDSKTNPIKMWFVELNCMALAQTPGGMEAFMNLRRRHRRKHAPSFLQEVASEISRRQKAKKRPRISSPKHSKTKSAVQRIMEMAPPTQKRKTPLAAGRMQHSEKEQNEWSPLTPASRDRNIVSENASMRSEIREIKRMLSAQNHERGQQIQSLTKDAHGLQALCVSKEDGAVMILMVEDLVNTVKKDSYITEVQDLVNSARSSKTQNRQQMVQEVERM